jgi:myo-inositol-1(or 4)-monophosphatase
MTQQPNCPLSAAQIAQVVTWAQEAGQIALGYFNNVTAHYKADQSFVTQADLEVEQFLAERLRATYPGFGLIAEEGARSPDHQTSIWTIDPIAGTNAFVFGLPGWGITLGLLHKGQPCFGLFYMPLLNDMTHTGDDLPTRVRAEWGPKGYLAVTSRNHYNYQINIEHTRTLGSVSANLIYTARGSASATFISKARMWDFVAGAAILARAGGELRYLSGASVDYMALLDGGPTPEPIIAGHPQLLPTLAQAIEPRAR